jgi:hypothetical protein
VGIIARVSVQCSTQVCRLVACGNTIWLCSTTADSVHVIEALVFYSHGLNVLLLNVAQLNLV